MKIPEIIAPAGDIKQLEAAIAHGADAVYIGIDKFNLRAHAPSFGIEEAAYAVKTAHNSGKRVYAVLNTMPAEAEIEDITALLIKLSGLEQRPDAVIVSDPGVFILCKKYLDGTRLHLSTQTGSFNSVCLSFWQEQGISRIVLPRELSLEEIKSINEKSRVETEVFIHGAMCVSISGRCLLGAYLGGRHPNRGDCPQPCRFRYSIAPDAKNGPTGDNWFAVEESKTGTYLLNSKDLNTISILDRIVATGVSALKIEGRNKSVHYVSSVVKTYRSALDRYISDPGNYCPDPSWIEELEKLDHRPYTTGFYSKEYIMQEPFASKSSSKIRVVGLVREIIESDKAVIEVKNPFKAGEALNILPVKRNSQPYETKLIKINELNGRPLDSAVTNRLVIATAECRLQPGDMIRRVNKT